MNESKFHIYIQGFVQGTLNKWTLDNSEQFYEIRKYQKNFHISCNSLDDFFSSEFGSSSF